MKRTSLLKLLLLVLLATMFLSCETLTEIHNISKEPEAKKLWEKITFVWLGITYFLFSLREWNKLMKGRWFFEKKRDKLRGVFLVILFLPMAIMEENIGLILTNILLVIFWIFDGYLDYLDRKKEKKRLDKLYSRYLMSTLKKEKTL